MKNNKKMIKLLLTLMVLTTLLGCNLNFNQIKVVAKNSGLAAAVTWISYDNPSEEQISSLSEILNDIKVIASSESSTYGELLFPVVEDNIEKLIESGKIEKNDSPLILAGSLAIFNGLDLLIMSNPEIEENKNKAVEIVNIFIEGAQYGLSLSDNDPRLVKARQSNSKRSRVFRGLSR